MKKIKAILTHIKGSPVTSSKEQCNIHDVVRSSQKKNPYKLVWYNQDWSQKRTDQNNIRYWKWEQEHNGLKLPQYYIQQKSKQRFNVV